MSLEREFNLVVTFARKTGQRRIWRKGHYPKVKAKSEHEARQQLLAWHLSKGFQVKSIDSRRQHE